MISLFVGKSGSGKSTYVNKFMMDSYDNDKPMKRIIMYTTRPKRYGELTGVEYYFVSDIDFINLDLSEQLLESKKYNVINPNNGDEEVWYYGTPKVDDYKEQDYICTATIDQAKEYIKYYGAEYIKIYLVYCDDTTRAKRVLHRNATEFAIEEFSRRCMEENKEFSNEAIIELLSLAKNITFIYNGDDKLEEPSIA